MNPFEDVLSAEVAMLGKILVELDYVFRLTIRFLLATLG